MNLNHQPTADQLRDPLAGHDDRAGHHVLWVDGSGEVRLTRLPKGRRHDPLPEEIPGAALRYETFRGGNGYVGPEAAADDRWVAAFFASLLRAWSGPRGGVVEYDGLLDDVA